MQVNTYFDKTFGISEFLLMPEYVMANLLSQHPEVPSPEKPRLRANSAASPEPSSRGSDIVSTFPLRTYTLSDATVYIPIP